MPHNQPPSPNTGPADNDTATLTDTALVPVASRHDGWTPERQRHFLETLADTGSVTAAAQAVGMSEQSARRLRRRADARAFDAAWEGALERAMQQLLPTAIDRALNGTLRQRYYHGELIAEERVHHDGLLLHLLERGAQSLGASRARRALRKNWDGAMAMLEAGACAWQGAQAHRTRSEEEVALRDDRGPLGDGCALSARYGRRCAGDRRR